MNDDRGSALRVAIRGDTLAGRIAAGLLAATGDTVVDGGAADATIDFAWCAGAPAPPAPLALAVDTGFDGPAPTDERALEDAVAAPAGVFATAISGQQGDGVAYVDVPVASVATAVQAVTALAAARWTGGPRRMKALLTRVPTFHKGTEFSDSEYLATVRATQLGASGVYRAADGRYVQLDAPSTRITTRLFRALDEPTALDALRRPLAEVTPEQAARIRQALTEAFAARSAAEWERLLSTADVPCGLCRTRAEWQASPWRGPALTFTPAPGELAAVKRPRVLDLSTIIAGPVCGRTLAALGWDVLKIDEPGEKPLWFPHLHIDANRGKRHLVLDLKSRTGRDRFIELVKTADVIVENARPGVWDRLGLGEAELRRVRPALVIASVRLYGPGHEASAWPGYETTAQAVSGLMARFALADGVPRRAGGGAINDYATGSLAAFGVLRAVASRRPGLVTTTLSGAASLFIDHAPAGSRVAAPVAMPAGAVNDAQLRDVLVAEGSYRYGAQPGWGRVGHVGYPVEFDPPLIDAWLPAPAWDEFSRARRE